MMTCRVAAQLKIVSCVECVEVQSSTFMRLCGQDPTIRGSNQSNAVGPTDCWGKFEHPSCRKFLVNGFCINQPVFKRRNLFSGRPGFCRNLQGGETNEVSQILLNTKGNYILKSFIFIQSQLPRSQATGLRKVSHKAVNSVLHKFHTWFPWLGETIFDTFLLLAADGELLTVETFKLLLI